MLLLQSPVFNGENTKGRTGRSWGAYGGLWINDDSSGSTLSIHIASDTYTIVA